MILSLSLNQLLNYVLFKPIHLTSFHMFRVTRFNMDVSAEYMRDLCSLITHRRCPENLEIELENFESISFLISLTNALTTGRCKKGLTLQFHMEMAENEMNVLINALQSPRCPERLGLDFRFCRISPERRSSFLSALLLQNCPDRLKTLKLFGFEYIGALNEALQNGLYPINLAIQFYGLTEMECNIATESILEALNSPHIQRLIDEIKVGDESCDERIMTRICQLNRANMQSPQQFLPAWTSPIPQNRANLESPTQLFPRAWTSFSGSSPIARNRAILQFPTPLFPRASTSFSGSSPIARNHANLESPTQLFPRAWTSFSGSSPIAQIRSESPLLNDDVVRVPFPGT